MLILLPFGMTLLPTGDPTTSIVDKFLAAAETYKGLSINALNFWRNPWTGIWDVQQWGSDQTVVRHLRRGRPSPWPWSGSALFAVAAVAALVAVARRDDMTGLLLGSLTMAVAFFGLPTRVHERYLFPALAIAAPLVGTAVRWAAAYVALSGAVLPEHLLGLLRRLVVAGDPPLNPGLNGVPFLRDPLLAATVFSQWGVWLVSLGSLVARGLGRVAGGEAACGRPSGRPSRARVAEAARGGRGRQRRSGRPRTRRLALAATGPGPARPSVTRLAASTGWTSCWWSGSSSSPWSSACGGWTCPAR